MTHNPGASEQPMTPYVMNPIDRNPEAQARRGWQIDINGEREPTVEDVVISSSRMGIEIIYADRPEGYDGVVIREPGGPATIPYMIDPDGRIFIGLVEESRPTMGEATTPNIPRGFLDPGETHEEAAARELEEETGLRGVGSTMIKLAAGLNPNSTYFDYSTSREAGVSIFAIPRTVDELEIGYDDDGNVFYNFPADVREQAKGDKTHERIFGSRFVPVTEALRSRDMFTSAAVGQLVGHLLSQGEYLLPQVPADSRA
jgi:8-oxo-dGTP pyrophosphatase MutT (NUDIX family)